MVCDHSKSLVALALRLHLSPQARADKAPKTLPGPLSYYDQRALEVSAMAKTKLTQSDREALQRALAMARAESEQERAHIDRELAEQGWQHAAETAAYHCQDSALRLKPWQTPPCWLRTDRAVQVALLTPPPDHRGRVMAAEVVQQLLAAGLSRFEPDPLRALAEVEASARVTRLTSPQSNAD